MIKDILYICNYYSIQVMHTYHGMYRMVVFNGLTLNLIDNFDLLRLVKSQNAHTLISRLYRGFTGQWLY